MHTRMEKRHGHDVSSPVQLKQPLQAGGRYTQRAPRMFPFSTPRICPFLNQMLYSALVKKLARQNFAYVQHHDYDAVLKAVVPNVTHHFAGDHALGGTRHDAEALRRWFERLGRVMPKLQFEIKQIWVKGMPWHTTVIIQWVATATLENGDAYVNPGVHIITMRWGKVYALEVSEDSQAVAEGLAKQAEAGIREAVAEKIES